MVINRKSHLVSPNDFLPHRMSHKPRLSSSYRVALSLVVVATILSQASVASAALTSLTEDAQGEGNKGFSWIPLDSEGNPSAFTMTARSSVDSSQPFSANAAGDLGTVYIKRGSKGAGVQDSSYGGSSGISGGGRDKDEELIFTYESPVSLDSILLELNDIQFVGGHHNRDEKDNPVLFISERGSGLFNTVKEVDIVSAFTFTADKKGILDFGALSPLLGYTEIDAFKIRETNGHLYVNSLSQVYVNSLSQASTVPVPAPSALLLGGLGTVFASWIHRRRNL